MSTTKELKEYLVNEDDGFLLNPDNNGKTIMLSGKWGAGKTHFWQNVIEQKLSTKLKEDDKDCVYVSLYGKDSLQDIKQEVFIKASLDREKEDEILSKEVSTFGFDALSSINNSDLKIGKAISALVGLNNWRKSNNGIEKLKDGGLICFDDFERKSKHIDLNDLFGFIAQLAIDMNCKIIIILNSDVFEGEEKNIFKTVKEKTVNKFFYFEPSRSELFDIIFSSDGKYKTLKDYKNVIFEAIDETEELNARIYIQVLDHCWEWIEKGYEYSVLRALVLSVVYFIKTNTLLPYPEIIFDSQLKGLRYINYLDTFTVISNYLANFGYMHRTMKKDMLFDKLTHEIHTRKKHSTIQEDKIINWIQENYNEIFIFFKYGYQLFLTEGVEENIYKKIYSFVKTGILPKKTKEVETSVPPESIAVTEA